MRIRNKLKPKNYNLKPTSGFTLIEIIVAISIFTVVMLVTMGALLTLNDASRKAQALRTVIDNLNFAVEDMNRKIRTGDSYRCYRQDLGEIVPSVIESGTKDCSGEAGYAISLKTQEKDPPITGNSVWVAYIFREDANGVGSIMQRKSFPGGGPGLDSEEVITAPEVDIDRMEFRVVGTTNQTVTQPMIIVNISGTVNLQRGKLRTNFSLQTAISRRGIE